MNGKQQLKVHYATVSSPMDEPEEQAREVVTNMAKKKSYRVGSSGGARKPPMKPGRQKKVNQQYSKEGGLENDHEA